MHKPIFALIDCNNFFVSCERLFRPDLTGKPIVVLSSNDGCAVARSNEAKALGIPMGAPAFKYRELFKQHDVIQFSANFELYGDISKRLIHLLTSITPRTEVYSVDESFLDLSELEITDYRAWGEALRKRIWREIGIPVSIGIAPSKTLAKLASERAKKDAALHGVLSFINLPDWLIDPQLEAVPVQGVWGIGWRLTPRMKALGIHTALQLKQLSLKQARQMMGVKGEQLIRELRGESCLPLEREHRVRQSIMHGRVFGEDTYELQVIEAAIASLTARATRRLRRDGLLARTAWLSVTTNKHKPNYQKQRICIRLDTPSADGGLIAQQLHAQFAKDYNPRYAYHRADVLLFDFVSDTTLQADLLGYVSIDQHDRSTKKLTALDAISEKFGQGSIGYAAEKLSQSWQPKRRIRSPRYTTSWNELPTARLGIHS